MPWARHAAGHPRFLNVQATVDLFADLHRVGIDKISYKKGPEYLTVVACQDICRLAWVGVGKSKATLRNFFEMREAPGTAGAPMTMPMAPIGLVIWSLNTVPTQREQPTRFMWSPGPLTS